MGYQVIALESEGSSSNDRIRNYDAYIVTGMNTNPAGINDTSTKATVINASGMSPERVYHELQLRL